MSILRIGAPDDADLTRAAARSLTDTARAALANAVQWASEAAELIEQAWAMRADIALGYPTWARYCEVEFAAVRGLRVPLPTRVEAVAHLADAGMSARGIAHAYGLADQTVRADLERARTPLQLVPVGILDSSPTVTEKAPVPQPTKADRALAALLAAGATGLTVHELGARARRGHWAGAWHHGGSSCVLSRLERTGAVVRTLHRRDGAAVYVHAEHGATAGAPAGR